MDVPKSALIWFSISLHEMFSVILCALIAYYRKIGRSFGLAKEYQTSPHIVSGMKKDRRAKF